MRMRWMLVAVSLGCSPPPTQPTVPTTTIGDKIASKHAQMGADQEKPKLGKAPSGTASPHSPHDKSGAVPDVVMSRLSPLPPSAPVLVVDGTTYTKQDVERSLRQAAAAAGVPPEMLDATMHDAFEVPGYEKLIERHVLASEAKRRQLSPSAALVEQRKKEMVSTLPDGKPLADVLAMLDTDEAGFVRDIHTDLSLAALLEDERKQVPTLTEEAARALFDKNPQAFDVPATATMHHIVLRIPTGADDATIAAVRSRIDAARERVVGKSQAEFEKVALEVSEDPSVQQNRGNVGSFLRGQMMMEVEAVAFALPKGRVSEVIRSSRGFHVLRGGGVTEARPKRFADVKAMIIKREQNKAFMERVDAMVQRLRDAAKIERLVEPLPSPLKSDDYGSLVPSWRPGAHNAVTDAGNPHGQGG
jgi:peptidyl-prolyl cis-trans isomerase C